MRTSGVENQARTSPGVATRGEDLGETQRQLPARRWRAEAMLVTSRVGGPSASPGVGGAATTTESETMGPGTHSRPGNKIQVVIFLWPVLSRGMIKRTVFSNGYITIKGALCFAWTAKCNVQSRGMVAAWCGRGHNNIFYKLLFLPFLENVTNFFHFELHCNILFGFRYQEAVPFDWCGQQTSCLLVQ